MLTDQLLPPTLVKTALWHPSKLTPTAFPMFDEWLLAWTVPLGDGTGPTESPGRPSTGKGRTRLCPRILPSPYAYPDPGSLTPGNAEIPCRSG